MRRGLRFQHVEMGREGIRDFSICVGGGEYRFHQNQSAHEGRTSGSQHGSYRCAHGMPDQYDGLRCDLFEESIGVREKVDQVVGTFPADVLRMPMATLIGNVHTESARGERDCNLFPCCGVIEQAVEDQDWRGCGRSPRAQAQGKTANREDLFSHAGLWSARRREFVVELRRRQCA